MPFHQSTLKQLIKALGMGTRYTTGFDPGRSYRASRNSRRKTIYYQDPQERQLRALAVGLKRMLNQASKVSNYRVGLYRRRSGKIQRYGTGSGRPRKQYEKRYY